MTVHDLVEAFIQGKAGKASSLRSEYDPLTQTTCLYSYAYPLAMRLPDGCIHINVAPSGVLITNTQPSWQRQQYFYYWDRERNGKPGYENKDAAFSITTNRHREM